MNFDRLNPRVFSAGAFEKAGRCDNAIAEHNKIIFLLSGELSYSVADGKRERLGPGALLLIPKGLSHSLRSKYMRAVAIQFELDGTDEPFDPFDKPILAEEFDAHRDELLKIAEIFSLEEGYFAAECSARLKLLLLKLAEKTDENALPYTMVENLNDYIKNNIGDEISNTELGAIFGYHPFYISRVLKDKKGITLHQYVVSYRVRLAKNMLEKTDKTVAEIADATGFTDASYLTKIFKAEYGVTPKEFRNRFKEEFI